MEAKALALSSRTNEGKGPTEEKRISILLWRQ